MTSEPFDTCRDESDLSRMLAEARDGSAQSEAELVEQCRAYLMAIAGKEVDSALRAKVAVSDVVQETLIRAQQKLGKFDGSSEAELLAWLRKILRNHVMDLQRKFRSSQKRSVSREVAVPPTADGRSELELAIDSATPGRKAAANEEIEQLRAAIANLPEDDRTVIALRNWENLPFSEVGRRMDRSADAARMLWTRAVQRLGKQMRSGDNE